MSPHAAWSRTGFWPFVAVGTFLAWGWWTSVPVLPADFWWHLGFGEDVVANRAIPTADHYSWVYGGQPFFDQPWLSQALYASLHRWGGLPLTIFVNGVVIGMCGALLLRACIRGADARRHVAAVVLVVLGIPAMTENWLVRPQTLAYPLFALVLLLVLERRTSLRASAVVFATMVVWTNTHGSFVLGVVLVALYTAHESTVAILDKDARRLSGIPFLLVGAAALGTMVNPRGIGVYSYVLGLTTSDTVREVVSEWAPTSLATLSGLMVVILVSVMLFGIVATKRRPDSLQMLLAVTFLGLGLSAGRHVVWFAMVMMPLIAGVFGRRTERASDRGPHRAVGGVVAVGMVVLLAVPLVRIARTAPDALGTAIPSPATLNALDELNPERLFNESGYGSYLIWRDRPVFFDPRFEFYPAAHIDEYFAISRGEDLDASIKRWNFDAMLVSRDLQPRLVDALSESDGWRLMAEDDDAILFTPGP